jgi:hypothetical protein
LDLKVKLVQRVLKVIKVFRVLLDLRVILVLKGRLDQQVLKGNRV